MPKVSDKIDTTIGLGILSWRGYRSLDNALQSYNSEQFFSLFDDTMIFLPDPDVSVKAVARKYPTRVETSSQNLGILNGMEEIAKRLQTEYIFFTENDCPLVEPQHEALRQINKALELLLRNKACMARMRHTRDFGELFDTLDKYYRYHPKPDTLTAKTRRLMRPEKARRIIGTSIYGEDAPAAKFPNYISKPDDGFYLVDTTVMPWTNQSIIINRRFFLQTIIPYCKSVPFKRGANGFRNLEIELNRSKFWTNSGWKIACGLGLLTHERHEDRGYT
ncbi:MAG: hypothetical protein V3U57_07650 [Robiginitomaculum sp.]